MPTIRSGYKIESCHAVSKRTWRKEHEAKFPQGRGACDKHLCAWGIGSRTVVNVSRLSDKVALVTGASKGIGAGIATALAAADARLVVNYSSDREGAEHVARAIIDSRGETIAVGADISKAADVAQLFKEVDSAFVRLNVLVNNAGTVLAGKTPLGRVTDIAPLAVFLASDESAWITGEVIRAAGGLVVAT